MKNAKQYHQLKSREHYLRNKEQYAERNRSRRDASLAFLKEVKSSGCVVCGEREHACLDMHHKDPLEKDFGFAECMTFKFERMKKEVAKCVVVCRNCHAKIHAGLIDIDSDRLAVRK